MSRLKKTTTKKLPLEKANLYSSLKYFPAQALFSGSPVFTFTYLLINPEQLPHPCK